MTKTKGQHEIEMLATIFNKSWAQQEVPKDWNLVFYCQYLKR